MANNNREQRGTQWNSRVQTPINVRPEDVDTGDSPEPTPDERRAESNKQRQRHQDTVRITVIGNGVLVGDGDTNESYSFQSMEDAFSHLIGFEARRLEVKGASPTNLDGFADRGQASARMRTASRRRPRMDDNDRVDHGKPVGAAALSGGRTGR